jgi:tetratricopeptide (TPR) repeat protein
MAADTTGNTPELNALFRKYESAPDSYVFAPLADAYRKAGQLDEAVEVCKKGVRKHSEYPSGHVVLGKCLFDLGAIEEADSSFRTVLGLDADNLVALKYLGMIEAGRGELDRAREHFKQILVLDPENREIRSMLEDLHTAAETHEEKPAREVKDEQFEGEPISLGDGDMEMSDDLATTTLADIYFAQGYTDKAAKIYTEVLRRQPDNEEIKKKLKDLLGHDIVGDDIEELDMSQETAEVSAETTREKTVEAAKPEGAGISRREDKRKVGEAAVAGPKGGDGEQHDPKSYDQFKRWLKNIQE